jgi:hypothetical protein
MIFLNPALVSGFQVQVPQATGSTIGGMTAGGGLAAAFDGTTSQTQAACCQIAVSQSGYGTNNTVGKDWGAGVTRTISRIKLWGPSDNNVLGAAGGTTLKLQGSLDNVTWVDLYTSGTILGSSGASVDVTTGITIANAYRYHRMIGSGNGTNAMALAEVQFFEDF